MASKKSAADKLADQLADLTIPSADAVPCTPAAQIMKPLGSKHVNISHQPARSSQPIRPKKHWCLKDFEIGPKKGEGKYGKVYVVRVKGLQLVCAMKTIRLRSIMPAQLERELLIHRELRHPHIVRLMTWFTDEKYAYIVMEWCNGGNIYEKMHAYGQKGFPEELSAKYVAQLTEAIEYLHSRTPPILHRDIKPENTFLDTNGDLKLGDFGWSAMMKNAKPRMTVCGTLEYFAPELCKKESYDTALDAWAIGVFMFEMLYGKPPFESPDGEKELLRKIQGSNLVFPKTPAVSDDAKELVASLLKKDPADRIGVSEILQHPWIQRKYYAVRKAAKKA